MFRPAFKNSIVKALSIQVYNVQSPLLLIICPPPPFKIGPLSIYDYHVKLIFTCTVYVHVMYNF